MDIKVFRKFSILKVFFKRHFKKFKILSFFKKKLSKSGRNSFYRRYKQLRKSLWFFLKSLNSSTFLFFILFNSRPKSSKPWPYYVSSSFSAHDLNILSFNWVKFSSTDKNLSNNYPLWVANSFNTKSNLDTSTNESGFNYVAVFGRYHLTRPTVQFVNLLRVINFYKPLQYQPFKGFFSALLLDNLKVDKILFLNFKKFRFFPSLQNMQHHLYTTTSLGVFSKFLNKGKSFIKNKLVYLLLAGFFRKLLMYLDFTNLILMVKRTPLYFREILNTINSPVVVNYKHPFTGLNIDEFKFNKEFYFSFFIFLNSKPYGYLKPRKKGRIKRKITKRVLKLNNITD